jgi:hypothetical protein
MFKHNIISPFFGVTYNDQNGMQTKEIFKGKRRKTMLAVHNFFPSVRIMLWEKMEV